MKNLGLSYILLLFSICFVEANSGISSNAPDILFYAGIGEDGIGEDPHAVHGIGTSDGGYLVLGKNMDGGGSSDAFALKVMPENWSGYLTLSSPAEAEGPSWSWSLSWGSSGRQDGFNQVAEVGSASFLVGFKGVTDGSEDACLLKVDSFSGNVDWEHVLSESQSGLSSAYEVVHSTPEGGLITGGVSNAYRGGLEGFKSYGNPSSGNAFVAYYSPSLLSASSAPTAPSWRIDFSDSLTVKAIRPLGQTGEFVLLTSGVEYPHEAILKRLDAQGGVLWSKSYPTRGEPTDLCVLSSSGALTGLAFCGHGGKSSGILDSYLTVLDLNGTLAWTREFGDPVGGVDKFSGLGAGNPKLIYDESWGIQATGDGGMIVASGTGIEGCDPWQGTDSNASRISILEECVSDPRSDWRGMITKFDAQGNQVWQRVDSFLSPEGDPTQSSACEYVSITSNGNLLSITDEAFGVGLLVLEMKPFNSIPSVEPGTLLWEMDLGARISSSPALAPDGTLYLGSDDKMIYALDGETGNEIWDFQTGNWVGVTPSIDQKGNLYAGSDDSKFYALNGQTGALNWDFQTGSNVTSSSAALASNGLLYFGSGDHSVYALDRSSGSIQWNYQAGNWIGSSPAVGVDAKVYLGSDDGKVYALDGLSGQLLWVFQTGGSVRSSPAIGFDGIIYVGSNDKKIYALDGHSGQKRWEFQTGGAVSSSPSVGIDGTVYFGSTDNKVYALDGGTGDQKWEFQTGNWVSSSPALGSDGTIYVGSDDYNIYALNGQTGAKQWEFRTGHWVNSSPALNSNGVLFFCSGTKVYSIQASSGPALEAPWPMFGKDVQRTGNQPNSKALLTFSGSELGSGWRKIQWFGFYQPDGSSNWLYHAELGWLFVKAPSLGSIWLYDQALNWLWTSESVFPFLWSDDKGEWIYYKRNSSPRSFYDYSNGGLGTWVNY